MPNILGAKTKQKWFGTEVSGYTEVPIAKKCGTCEYIVKGRLCKQKTVLTDKKIKTDKNGLKIVDSENGCCSFWSPKD